MFYSKVALKMKQSIIINSMLAYAGRGAVYSCYCQLHIAESTSSGKCQFVHQASAWFTAVRCTPGCPYITSTTIMLPHPYSQQGDLYYDYENNITVADAPAIKREWNKFRGRYY